MPALFVFLLKVNIALLLFCAGYYAVLKHLTFYTLNRIYLVGAILFASVYPLINLDDFARQHQHLTQPVQVVLELEAPAQSLVKPLARPDYWQWLTLVFWMGAALVALRLLIQLYSLMRLYRDSKPENIQGYDVRVVSGDAGPFSFWKSIYVNPAKHNATDLQAILQHEQVHVNQWHTLDILLAELSTVFYWFNPGVWLMKKAVRENIEFITDRKILNNGIDSKQYQYSLVNVCFAATPNNVVNHFNLSTIKKRIIMMNAKRSSKFNLTRYAFLMPAVIALLLVFSVSKAAFVTSANKVIHKMAGAIRVIETPATPLNKAVLLQPAPLVKHLNTTFYAADTTKAKKTADAKTDTTFTGKFQNFFGKTPIYLLDGKVVSKDELNKLNPDEIATINVGKSNDSDVGVVNVTTKAYSSKSRNIDAIRVNGNDLHFGTSRLTYILRDSIKPGIHPDTIYSLGVTGAGQVSVSGKGLNKVMGVYTPAKPGVVSNLSAITVNGKPWTTYDFANYSTDISHLTNKLIIIDGKEATEKQAKKLSLFDIDRIAVKNDAETKSLYGDRAKNGIVFIVTKKTK
jgi:hypothetical protein